jgi:ABC-type phosphate transport system substrate-binding protein
MAVISKKSTVSVAIEVDIADSDQESYEEAYEALAKEFPSNYRQFETTTVDIQGTTVIYSWKAEL